ncbi:MAG: enoyl-CoA hydratase/isomerase family protein [Deltaproteobacteria bacterium]|nr:enoyl-CoA hydratase/isomerase family protein [Deltaproteobacteria bacterium]
MASIQIIVSLNSMERKVLFIKSSPYTGRIVLNNPSRKNAMDEQLAADFEETVNWIRADSSDLKLIIIQGAQGNFSSGGDIRMLKDKTNKVPHEQETEMLRYYRSFSCIKDLDVPTIAIIEGWCIGAGLCLAALCDLRIGVTGAKFSAPFIRLGLFPGLGSTDLLFSQFGDSLATFLLITGETLNAERAFTSGFLHWLASDSNDAESIVTNLETHLSGIPMESIKLLVRKLRSKKFENLNKSFELEALAQTLCYSSEWFKNLVSSKTS